MLNKKPEKIIGTVFDIQRFSINDGPGIRTTVFLKGCLLKCIWCHNPESQTIRPQLSFKSDLCQNCLNCISACPNHVHFKHNGQHFVNFSNCNLNGDCTEICPNDALEIIGEKKSVRQVMDIVLNDIQYYKNSGGGLTISGGEPLLQIDFTSGLLQEAKKNHIHTCVDTSGYSPTKNFEQIISFTDLFLFDYKITDIEEHIKYTGVDPDLILHNLEYLNHRNSKVVLRCPIVPGLNDNDEHFSKIVDISNKYPNIICVELMPYHDFGRKKSKEIGLKSFNNEFKPVLGDNKKKWIKQLKSLGFQLPKNNTLCFKRHNNLITNQIY